ncbi:transcriptional regulator [Paenibacillus darwinianus]|uniref:Transcriptional regulator n=1 Tax=Paenibacillus darwinianus TaxID=1380763 RepID=A0A9W5S095_9BACL|nr:sugar diacid recognition domain-containing protein [Paenibacillus darwinianus]EXX87001.1 transcriptional regulator [Paenibacillus darwinianus]EXX87156.1 transcriptional regulator [Paenibacillus darwinianus]EXX87303.1 transcriptional regulator [Paenibacillus darwinianus]
MLTKQLAEEIVAETMLRLNRNINIIDVDGTIMASGDAGRVGEYHEAAATAIKREQTVAMQFSDLPRWRGAQAGVNMPIRYGRQVIGAIGITGDPEEVEPFGQLVHMTAELLIRQHYSRLQDEWRQMAGDLIVEELLKESDSIDFESVDARLEAIRHPLKPPYQMAVVRFTDSARQRTEESVPIKVRRLLEGSRVLISPYRPQRLLLLFSETAEDRVMAKLKKLKQLLLTETESFCVGVGSSARLRTDIRRSYEEGEAALSCAGSSDEPIVYFDEVEGQALVRFIPVERRQRLAGKLRPHWNAKMEETLESFFACSLNAAEAASRLGIHRNTLLYRLEKVKETTGYDPARFRDAMILQMMVWSNG